MKKYLVIGNPIEHSLSPLIHNYWMKKHCLFDSIYEKRKVEEKDLKNIITEIRDEKIIAFKKTIIPFLDELHIYAEDTQSVNTVKKVKNKIVGYNTDRLGFGKTIDDFYSQGGSMLEPIDRILDGKNIFILGAGGVTSSIISTLEQKGGNLIISNRTKSKAEELKILFPKIGI